MITEAIETVEAVIWGAVISFGILTAFALYIAAALTYWTAVFARWAGRSLVGYVRYRRDLPARRAALATERRRSITEWQQKREVIAAATPPHIPTQPGHNDDLLADCWAAWTAKPRKENET